MVECNAKTILNESANPYSFSQILRKLNSFLQRQFYHPENFTSQSCDICNGFMPVQSHSKMDISHCVIFLRAVGTTAAIRFWPHQISAQLNLVKGLATLADGS